MKKALWVVVAVVMLAGCGAIPTKGHETAKKTVQPAKPEVSITTTTISSSFVHLPSPTQFISPSVLEEDTPTLVPTPGFTNTPYQDAPICTSIFPPIKSKKINHGFAIGTVSIQKDNFVYYTVLTDDLFDKSTIMLLNLTTGKVKKLRDADTIITQIFVDSDGKLYYVRYKKGEEWNSMLYQYNKSGDVLIADNIGCVERVDKDNIYYTKSFNIENEDGSISNGNSWTLIEKYNLKEKLNSRVAAIQDFLWPAWFVEPQPLAYFISSTDLKTYVMNLEDGKIYKVSEREENYLESIDGSCLMKYEQVNGKTKFNLYNYNTLKGLSCVSPIMASKFYCPVVVNNRLFIFTDNSREGSWDITQSTIFEIDLKNGALLSKTNLDYVSDVCVYQGKLYLYTFKMRDDVEGVSQMIGQKVQVFDPITHRYSVVASLGNRTIGDDKEFLFEVCGGYVWMILISGCEGASYEWWKRFPISAVNPTATPSLRPTLSPSPSPSPEPTATSTANPGAETTAPVVTVETT